MIETLRVVLTLLVFAAALGSVLIRPQGWNEAWWTVGGAIILLEKSGFFDWAGIRAARAERADARRLFRNVFLLGSVITAALSLDTTAVILTPLTLAFVTCLKVPAWPYVFACAFVANMQGERI